MKALKQYCCVIISLITLNSFAQSDSVSTMSEPVYWTPRYSISMQKSPGLGVGIARLSMIDKGLEFGSWCLYSSVDAHLRISSTDPQMFYSLKGGFETSWVITMWALEAACFSDFEQSLFVVTPKTGFSIGGVINLLYGYNISKKIEDFPGLGHHQISLVVNMNRKVLSGE